MGAHGTSGVETSRDTVEGDAFLVESGGERMYALATVKRGAVRFLTADGSTLPSAEVIDALVARGGLDSNAQEPPAAIIEWNGKRYHGLATAKRGKTFYRTADGRTLGRGTVLDELIPHEVAPVSTPAVPEPEVELAAMAAPLGSGHWADAIPTVATATPPEPVATAALEVAAPVVEADVSVAEAPVAPPAPIRSDLAPQTDSAVVLFDGKNWSGSALDGTPNLVWEGKPRLGEIDAELAIAQHRVSQLIALRKYIDTDRETAIVDNIKRFAEVDGVLDLAAATPEQLAAWRRYAEGIVGD